MPEIYNVGEGIGPARKPAQTTPVGQHGGCGLPMVIVARFTRRQVHPDEHVGEYDAQIERWQCPCGCTVYEREGRTALEGNIG